MNGYMFQAKGSGKSGLMSISKCGQQVLERTALSMDDRRILVRFEVGFPANGRTINAPELEKILFRFVPECVKRALYYSNMDAKKIQEVVELADDQQAIREQLPERGIVAFVANGAMLPRESGVSDRPMRGAVPFESPESMEVELTLPHNTLPCMYRILQRSPAIPYLFHMEAMLHAELYPPAHLPLWHR